MALSDEDKLKPGDEVFDLIPEGFGVNAACPDGTRVGKAYNVFRISRVDLPAVGHHSLTVLRTRVLRREDGAGHIIDRPVDGQEFIDDYYFKGTEKVPKSALPKSGPPRCQNALGELLPKNQICLHYTEGSHSHYCLTAGRWGGHPSPGYNTIIAGQEDKGPQPVIGAIGVPYLVARSGSIYEYFDDQYWGYSSSAGSQNARIIAIELENLGTTTGGLAASDIWTLPKPYREVSKYARFTDKQYEATRKLLGYLCAKYKIPFRLLPDDDPDPNKSTRYRCMYAYDVAYTAVPPYTLPGAPSPNSKVEDWSGIVTHVNYAGKGGDAKNGWIKRDIGPAFEWNRILGDSPARPYDIDRSGDSPTRYLFRQETGGEGGIYALGSHQNIHGGVHVTPDPSSDAKAPSFPPIQALGPGAIVAARLAGGVPPSLVPADTSSAQKHSDLCGEMSGGTNAFVLVRHVLKEIVAEKGDASPKVFTFYSLYMHLAHPDWSDPSEAYATVPWITSLLCRRYGSVQHIDPTVSDLYSKEWTPAEPLGDRATLPPQTLKAYSETFTQTKTVDLGKADLSRVVAISRPPDDAVKDALTALALGKVVTFASAPLPLREGETIALADGFIHWEILSPAGDDNGLKGLIDFATQKLKLKPDLFRTFEEQHGQANNLFDPDGKDLSTLLGFLPDEDGADKASLLHPNYLGSEVARLFGAKKGPAQPLVFSPGPPKPDPAKGLAYPLRISIENHKGALSTTEKRKIDVSFVPADLPPTKVFLDWNQKYMDIWVPASAKEIVLESDGFYMDPVTLPPSEAIKTDIVPHFQRIASARLRNVILKHLNEWSVTGLLEAMKARFENTEADLKPYTNAVAFWANDEIPIAGQDGSKKALFADEPDASQLKKETDLDHVHPVIFGWMIDLMSAGGMARLEAGAAPKSSGAVEKLLYLGWMPAYDPEPQRRMGDTLYAVAVAAMHVDGTTDLILEATCEGSSMKASIATGRFKAGIFSSPAILCPFWGEWTLAAKDLTPKVSHAKLTVPEPKLGAASAPERDPKTGDYTWTLRFDENAPRTISGVMLADYCISSDDTPGNSWTAPKTAIVVTAAAIDLPAPGLNLDDSGNYVLGAVDVATKVTQDYDLSLYQKVFAIPRF